MYSGPTLRKPWCKAKQFQTRPSLCFFIQIMSVSYEPFPVETDCASLQWTGNSWMTFSWTGFCSIWIECERWWHLPNPRPTYAKCCSKAKSVDDDNGDTCMKTILTFLEQNGSSHVRCKKPFCTGQVYSRFIVLGRWIFTGSMTGFLAWGFGIFTNENWIHNL